MTHRRAVVPAVVGVVVLTAVAFGPLVSGLSLASETGPDISNGGSLSIDSVEFPHDGTIEPASYGAANAYLTVPPATVRFASIRGNPMLVYKLRVTELGYSVSTTHFLDAADHGPTYEATIDPMTVDDSQFQRRQYAAELSVVVRDSDGRRVAASRNVTVRVVE
ncbi:hypothetical protein [Haloarcula onubensis]|uniref:DUF1102 domain-containing protein n=1 Tax=Haloarcula onubensis TaxID=2950539 RepID=A0ABU2FMN4_9EURY|nr:hypothetical protein [Halomicroarcula sp. S3CR25-11]MDS0281552.1 hypothetical protein [Halomicroarcula sp. S3CR25-11]